MPGHHLTQPVQVHLHVGGRSVDPASYCFFGLPLPALPLPAPPLPALLLLSLPPPPKMPSNQLVILVRLVPCTNHRHVKSSVCTVCIESPVCTVVRSKPSAPFPVAGTTEWPCRQGSLRQRGAHPLPRVALPKGPVLLCAAAREGGAKAAGLEARDQRDCKGNTCRFGCSCQ